MTDKYKNGAWKSTSKAQDAFLNRCFEIKLCDSMSMNFDQVNGSVIYYLYSPSKLKIVDVVVDRKGKVVYQSIYFNFSFTLDK